MDDHKSAFLGVEKSLRGNFWAARLDAGGSNNALNIAQKTGLPEIIARVLAGRDISPENAENHLRPMLRDLMPDPASLTDMDKAITRLADAIKKGERVAIFGDYDVDGAASSALMARFFKSHNLDYEIYIPDRIFEGYGPNPQAIDELIERGAGLIVTVDCGSTSFEALKTAHERGVDVVVIDHHQVTDKLPVAAAIVNPNRDDDLSGLGYLCAAGVCFMTLVALQRELRQQNTDAGADLMAMLDLVALATICDVVPLVGLNRAFVVRGLELLRQSSRPGLDALAKAARLDGPISAYHLGFMIGPRINAGGRIGDAALGSRLLAGDDVDEVIEIATTLDRLNAERQEMERIMLEEAMSEAESEFGVEPDASVIMVGRKGWHPGVVGILASRLKDRFHLPAFAIAFDGNGKGTASGRSILGVDIGQVVRAAVEAGVIAKGGGHAMAAGLNVDKNRLGDLRAFFDKTLGSAIKKATARRVLKIDGALSARGATNDLMELLEHAGPYGAGNPAPLFAFPSHRVIRPRIVGKDHLALTLLGGDGAKLPAILFRSAHEPIGQALRDGEGQHFHFAGTLGFNVWQGRKTLQLRLSDAVSDRG